MKRSPRYHIAVPGSVTDDLRIKACLERIVRSPTFARSPQARRFLEYVAGRALDGAGSTVKAYTIGVQALGVTGDRSCPETAARMQASRLRRLLRRYYETAGAGDEFEVQLPQGSYVPTFIERRSRGGRDGAPARPGDDVLELPSVKVEGFECVSEAKDQVLGRALAESLVSLLVSTEGIRVSEPSSRNLADFALTGSIIRLEGCLRVNASLRRIQDEQAIWSERFDVLEGGDLRGELDRAASSIAAQIGDPISGAVSVACREQRDLSVGYAALQEFFRFLRQPSEAGLREARSALERVMPVCGGRALLHGAYALLLALGPLFGFGKTEDLSSADAHARAALADQEPGPFGLLARALLAYHEREAGRAERFAREALEASGASSYLRALSGNVLALSGQWDDGKVAVQEALLSAPRLPGYLQTSGCLDLLLRKSDPAAALTVAQKISREAPGWGSLLEAAALMVLGQAGDARRAAARVHSLSGLTPKQLERRLTTCLPSASMTEPLLAAMAEVGLLPPREARPSSKYAASGRVRSLPHEVRVGILHSLSGPMSMCETHLVNAAMLAIEEINSSGGLLGRPLRAIVEDGASSPEVFQRKAERLLREAGVQHIFGCWMSSSRKAVLPAVEAQQALLWYPLQYEGLERSRNVIYTGSSLNQQVEPAVTWALGQGHRTCLLVGSDYVYPRTANRLIRGLVETAGGTIVGEHYVPLGFSEPFAELARTIQELQPDLVFNTLNGVDNVAFFRELERAVGSIPTRARRTRVLSFSLSEIELQSIGAAAQGHFACWSYFQSIDSPENVAMVRRYRGRYGEGSVLSDPIVTAYAQMHLFSQAATRAGSLETDAVLPQLIGSELDLGGEPLAIRANHHVNRRALIGRARSDRQFEIVWRSPELIAPEPWLGVDQADIFSRNLVLEALRALPEMAERTSRLEAKAAQGWS